MDWDRILGEIFKYIHYEYTQKYSPHHPYLKTGQEIDLSYKQLASCIKINEESSESFTQIIYSLPNSCDLFESVKGLKKEQILSIQSLNFVALLIELSKELLNDFPDLLETTIYHLKKEDIHTLNAKFSRPIRKFLKKDGEIDYTAHPVIAPIYLELSGLESALRSQMYQIARSPSYAQALQYEEYDIINERYVLALKSDSYKAEMGQIVAHSKSGMTLFVEPPQIKSQSNKKILLQSKIDEIISQICRQYSQLVFPYADLIIQIRDCFTYLDFIQAKARYSLEKSLTRPEISDNFSFSLTNFFHPLIQNPVKNDLEIDTILQGAVISGPNTGGKTVALKSVVLAHLFMHFGLYVPAKYARLAPLKGLFYFSNDNQNIEMGLSSFASEVKNYLDLLDQLENESLIVIDEVFNSTSSEEASALALGFLQEIKNRFKTKVFISTHHQLFKTKIHMDSTYLSCHMGYNHKDHRPTYQLVLGHPGSSMALEIFDLIGKSRNQNIQSIKDIAQSILDKKQLSYEQLLTSLSKKISDYDVLIKENNQLNQNLKNQKQSMEGILRLEKKKLLDEFHLEIKSLTTKAKKILQLTKEKKVVSPKVVDREMSALVNEASDLSPFKKEQEDHSAVLVDQLVIGQLYYSNLLKKNVTLLEIDKRKKTIKVSASKMLLTCPIDSLSSLAKATQDYNKKQQLPLESINLLKEFAGKTEIDLRGQRLDDFKRAVDDIILEIKMGHVPYVSVIHGHGEGILKSWLRNSLKQDNDLTWDNQDGNDGVTRIYLKPV